MRDHMLVTTVLKRPTGDTALVVPTGATMLTIGRELSGMGGASEMVVGLSPLPAVAATRAAAAIEVTATTCGGAESTVFVCAQAPRAAACTTTGDRDLPRVATAATGAKDAVRAGPCGCCGGWSVGVARASTGDRCRRCAVEPTAIEPPAASAATGAAGAGVHETRRTGEGAPHRPVGDAQRGAPVETSLVGCVAGGSHESCCCCGWAGGPGEALAIRSTLCGLAACTARCATGGPPAAAELGGGAPTSSNGGGRSRSPRCCCCNCCRWSSRTTEMRRKPSSLAQAAAEPSTRAAGEGARGACAFVGDAGRENDDDVA